MPETSSGRKESASARKWLALGVLLCLVVVAIWLLRSSDPATGNSGAGGIASADAAKKKEPGTNSSGSGGYGSRWGQGSHSGNGAGAANEDEAARRAHNNRRERLKAGRHGHDLAAGGNQNGNGNRNGAGNGMNGGGNGGNGAGKQGNRGGNPFFGGGIAGFFPNGSGGFGAGGGGAGIPPGQGTGPGPVPPGGPSPGDQVYVVRFKDSVTDPKREAEQMSKLGFRLGHVYAHAIKGFSAAIPQHVLPAVMGDPRVKDVEASQEYRTTQFGNQITPTGIERINAHTNRFKVGDGKGTPALVVIAIVDTGCDVDHPDLNVAFHANFVFGTTVNDDDNGHGTHVAGIAAAIDNRIGVVGVAPGAKVWGIKVLDDGGAGTLPDILAGLDFVAEQSVKVQVANCSFGGGFSLILNDAVEALWDLGIVVCVSAGNDTEEVSDDIANGHSPASAIKVLTIAAMGDSDGKAGGNGIDTSAGPDDTFADFSNYGELCDFIAPGVDIFSTWPLDIDPTFYDTLSGTSQAAPHVAGMAALILRTPDKIRNIRNPKPSGPEVPDIIREIIKRAVVEYIPGINGEGLLYPLVNVRYDM